MLKLADISEVNGIRVGRSERNCLQFKVVLGM